MTSTSVRLVGSAGEIQLRDDAADYLRTTGGSGWGMVPVVNSFFEGAGDGSTFRSTRRTARSYVLPVVVFGGGRQQVEDRLRALTRVARDPLRIYMDYSDGRSYWIPAIYDSGASGAYTGRPDVYSELPFVFTCPDPYWTSVETQSFKIESGLASNPLLPEVADLWVGPSAAIGSVQVQNVGDVPSNPTWIITGPAAAGTGISVNGAGFTIVSALVDAEVITISRDVSGWSVTDQTGANRYPSLGYAPVFPALPAGESMVDVVMTGVSPASSVVGIYAERREVCY